MLNLFLNFLYARGVQILFLICFCWLWQKHYKKFFYRFFLILFLSFKREFIINKKK